jgi:hypothetical protein
MERLGSVYALLRFARVLYPNRSMMLVSDTECLVRYSPPHVMRYVELVLYAFAKFVIWYSVVLLFGIVAVEVATCPAQNRFVKSGRSGATYVCDRNGDIARSNAVLRKLLHQGGEADEPPYAIGSYLGTEGLPHRSP